MSSDTDTSALHAWRALLGDAHVDAGVDARGRAEVATFATSQRVLAVLRPESAEEVAGCVRIARAHAVPLYPVSGARNWGYGSRVPVTSGSVIVDLARMNRISDYDDELACVRVDAGVTQRQLYGFLAERGAKLWMDPTASSAHASVLANALERGHGFTPYADHASKVCDLEVVLGTGETLRTGFRAHGANAVAPLDNFGVGPQLDGLFFQSAFGIVTRATLWLLRAPEEVELAVIRLGDDESLARAVDALRPLRLEGTLRSGPRFSNVYRALMYRGYPWDELGDQTPLPLDRAREIGARAGVAPWSGIAGLFGTSAEVAAQRARVKAALDGIGELRFYGEREIEALPQNAGSAQLRAQFAIFRGRVVGEGPAASLPYWRKRDRSGATAPDLERDRCGTLWTTAVTPFRGEDVRRLAERVTEVILRGGFEPDISCIALRERSLIYHISITYDRDAPGDDERALRCGEVLRAALHELGYPPYRLGIHSMDSMNKLDAVSRSVLRAMKDTLDPDGVIAPGRYLPDGPGA